MPKTKGVEEESVAADAVTHTTGIGEENEGDRNIEGLIHPERDTQE